MKILNVTVITRNPDSTDIEVECRYEGAVYHAITEIAEGRSVPNCTLKGYTALPAEEFVIALHEALGVQAAGVVAEEMRRICEE